MPVRQRLQPAAALRTLTAFPVTPTLSASPDQTSSASRRDPRVRAKRRMDHALVPSACSFCPDDPFRRRMQLARGERGRQRGRWRYRAERAGRGVAG